MNNFLDHVAVFIAVIWGVLILGIGVPIIWRDPPARYFAIFLLSAAFVAWRKFR